MGRHEKIGSARKEKMYALRKKLDDFIEEDKKRRDRNVYILERFEKMRSTVALLKSINHNNITIDTENSARNLMMRNNERVILRQDILNNTGNCVDDSYILKEIAKKYILIPRVYPINRYPIIDVKQSEDVDWRSKYNILNELKKNEREEVPERDTTERVVQKESKLRSNNITSTTNINSIQQDEKRHNISIRNGNISSFDIRSEPTSSSINSNDSKSDNRVDEDSNVQNYYEPVHENLNVLNVNKQINMSFKSPESNSELGIDQDPCVKIPKEQEISQNNYDLNARGPNEIQHTKELYSNQENYEEIEKEILEVPLEKLSESGIDETALGTINQQEPLYIENIGQNVENNQAHLEDTSEAREINYADKKYNAYYQEPQPQQELLESYNNVEEESEEVKDNQNYQAGNENSYENDKHCQNYENYEEYNNYPVEDQNHDYQHVDQNTEYNNSNNNFTPDRTQEINEKFNENQQNHDMHESGVETVEGQQIYNQHNYVDPTHAEIQQPYIDNSEIVPNSDITEIVQERKNPEQTYGLQGEYNAQNQPETEQQFEAVHYSGVENERGNLQQDYNENFNEAYHDNQGIQEAYDYSTQEQEIQQHDLGYNGGNQNDFVQYDTGSGLDAQNEFGEEIQQHDLGYNGGNQNDFVQYDTGSGLDAQNEFGHLTNPQENYGGQKIHEMYQEENSQHNVQDNEKYNYTLQSDETQHNDVNDPQIAQESYAES